MAELCSASCFTCSMVMVSTWLSVVAMAAKPKATGLANAQGRDHTIGGNGQGLQGLRGQMHPHPAKVDRQRKRIKAGQKRVM